MRKLFAASCLAGLIIAGAAALAYAEPNLSPQNPHGHITNPRLVAAGTDGEGPPWIARLAARRLGVFVADVA